MSNPKSKTAPTTVTPETNSEDVVEGTVIDESTVAKRTVFENVKHFTKKYKTALVATTAGIGGFVLHAFLSDNVTVEFGPEDDSVCEIESHDDEIDIVIPDSE